MVSLFGDLHVFVFSYNRGRSLDQCLASVSENLAGAPVTVLDDGSTDRATQEVLEKWSNSVSLIRTRGEVRNRRVGGLHQNMGCAFRHAQGITHSKYALMLQDDMQVVRKVRPQDLDHFNEYFEHNRNSVELLTSFWPFNRQGFNLDWEFDASDVASFNTTRTYTSAYSDTGLFHVNRFVELFGALKPTERANEAKASGLGLVMGHYRYPFTMFMPFPRTHRSGRRSPVLRAVEFLSGAGVHNFEFMPERRVDALFARTDKAPPVARDWLSSPTVESLALWSYYGGARDLRARLGWRGKLGEMLGEIPPQIHEDSWDCEK